MHMRTFTVVLISLLAAPGICIAQDAKKPPATEFSGDVGFVSVSGNTSITTLNAGEKLVRRIAPWEFKQDLGVVYGKTEGTESSNLWRTSVRADYGLGKHFAVYGRTAFDRDKFAGIKSRFAEGLGGVAKILASNVDQLNLEAGFEITQQKNLDATDDNFTALRAATTWKHNFTKTAYAFQGVEVLPNLDDSKDLRVNAETALVAPLSTHVAMKLSYQVHFDNEPALNAAGTAPLRKSDRILSTGIQIAF